MKLNLFKRLRPQRGTVTNNLFVGKLLRRPVPSGSQATTPSRVNSLLQWVPPHERAGSAFNAPEEEGNRLKSSTKQMLLISPLEQKQGEQSSGRELHAPPLLPLRERDVTALSSLFEREDSDEIEADINRSLLYLYPEPCWEDDPFDFLREYLC